MRNHAAPSRSSKILRALKSEDRPVCHPGPITAQQETDRLSRERRTKIRESCAWPNRAPVGPVTRKIRNLPRTLGKANTRTVYCAATRTVCPRARQVAIRALRSRARNHYDSHYSAAHHRVSPRNTPRIKMASACASMAAVRPKLQVRQSFPRAARRWRKNMSINVLL